jgi:hypothetical protein
MISYSIRAAAVATAFAATVFSATPSAYAAAFDGPWSVVIITRNGACDQSYRFGVTIHGSQVVYQGGGMLNVSGRVNKSGHVTVNVASGGQNAYGSGRLSRGRGGGTWRGQGTQGACSGTWSASQG